MPNTSESVKPVFSSLGLPCARLQLNFPDVEYALNENLDWISQAKRCANAKAGTWEHRILFPEQKVNWSGRGQGTSRHKVIKSSNCVQARPQSIKKKDNADSLYKSYKWHGPQTPLKMFFFKFPPPPNKKPKKSTIRPSSLIYCGWISTKSVG